jgi:hypothetical protein
MTKPAAIFRACYSDWRLIRTRKCVQLVFEVPLEESNKAYEALGGMPNPGEEAWVAIARLNPETVKEVMPVDEEGSFPQSHTIDTQSREEVMPDTSGPRNTPNDTSPASGPDIPARAHKPVAADKRLVQRAAILCADPLFWKFLGHDDQGYTITREDEAAEVVRKLCAVSSRSEIKPNTPAGRLFDHLYSRFVAWRDADIYVEASA